MKTQTKLKALMLVLCAGLIALASVFGTLAYLTSTDTVTNTFTVGNVAITLDEAVVDELGNPLKNNQIVEKVEDADRTEGENKGNKYHLLPGHEYTKDPTVTVTKNSEEAYVRMMVTVTFDKPIAESWVGTGLDSIFVGYNETKWIRNGAPTITKERRFPRKQRLHRMKQRLRRKPSRR